MPTPTQANHELVLGILDEWRAVLGAVNDQMRVLEAVARLTDQDGQLLQSQDWNAIAATYGPLYATRRAAAVNALSATTKLP